MIYPTAQQPNITVLLMVGEPAARCRAAGQLMKAEFKVLPFTDGQTVYDFAKLSDAGCVILSDVGGLSADGSGVVSSGHEQPTGVDLPLILLVTDKERDNLAEEVRRRADYFLVEPVSEHDLSAIVQAASAKYMEIIDLRREVKRRSSAIGSIVSGAFEIKTLDEARNLATMLSLACPDPENAATGLLELLVNAIEHGNLGIGFALKSELLAAGQWHSEISRRLDLAENREKMAKITFQKTTGEIEIRVIDAGCGFDKDAIMAETSDPFRTHGRGIQIAETLCFDSLRYLGGGNMAVAVIRTE